MKKIVGMLILITFFLTSCNLKSGENTINNVKQGYPEDFNIIFKYNFEYTLNLRENKYIVGNICYNTTVFQMPFSTKDKDWIYGEIISQDLLNYNETSNWKYLKNKSLACTSSTTNTHLFSVIITINNKTNEIITDAEACCCLDIHDNMGYLVDSIWYNETEIFEKINDSMIHKIYNQQKELRRFVEEIKSMINTKLTEFNITLPKPNPHCGYA